MSNVATTSNVSTIEAIQELMNRFEAAKISHRFAEAWSARVLADLFQYKYWHSFKNAVDRARKAIIASGVPDYEHIELVDEDTSWGYGATGYRGNYILTRHGAYMLMQELKIKDSVLAAFAKSYFSAQTQNAERIQANIKELDTRLTERHKLKESHKTFSQTLWDRGIDGNGIRIVISKGDKALFGSSTYQLKIKYGMKPNKALGDRMSTTGNIARRMSQFMTIHNINQNNLKGPLRIEKEHIDNNMAMREMLLSRGIDPSALPSEEDTVKLERQLRPTTRKVKLATKPKLAIECKEPIVAHQALFDA